MAQVIFASNVHFFYNADREWCLRYVLPLLNWTHPTRARRAWEGFLTWGQFDNQLLQTGLLAQYVEAATRIEEFPDALRRQLYGHLATIALRSQADPVADGWASNFTATTAFAARVGWIKQIGWQLSTLPADDVEQNWRRWMRLYWETRLSRHIPNPLRTTEEASAMAVWVVYLTESVEDGTRLATARPAGITQHSRLLHELTSQRIAQAPASIARLLGHLLQSTQRPFYDCYEIQRIVKALSSDPASADTTAIREQAVRLGCADAPTW